MYTNLKLQIWKSGLRQNRLAQLLGMHETVLSKIVNGFRKPSDSMRARIAEVLHSDEAWLFQCEEEPSGVLEEPVVHATGILEPAPPISGLSALPSDSGGIQ